MTKQTTKTQAQVQVQVQVQEMKADHEIFKAILKSLAEKMGA